MASVEIMAQSVSVAPKTSASERLFRRCARVPLPEHIRHLPRHDDHKADDHGESADRFYLAHRPDTYLYTWPFMLRPTTMSGSP